ncbi:MAG: dTDP-glucose 4,6-dehydratase [Pseudomonadota bacterium]
MKLMVTGGAGFIGSALIRLAISQGHRVLNVDKLTYAANLANLASVEAHPSYTFEQSDITDRNRMRALLAAFQPDAVLNLAAESHVDRSIDGPQPFIGTNIVGTFQLLEAVRASYRSGELNSQFRFIQVSTDEVFGSLGDSGAFDESSPYRPNSPYSASKASGDMLVRAWGGTYNLPVITTHCSNNYGPCQFPEKLIPVVIEKACRGEAIPVYGDGQNVRDWLYVGDHAEALLRIARAGIAGETYAIGGEAERSNLALVETLCSLLDERFPAKAAHARLIKFVTDRPGHDRRYAIDPSKLKRTLGWSPRWPFEEGLAKTLDWYLANPDWVQAVKDRGHTGERLGLSAEGRS